MRRTGPRPVVTFEGRTYTARRYNVEIPDLDSMDRIEALMWLIRNTTPRGYHKAPNPLLGYGGVVKIDGAS